MVTGTIPRDFTHYSFNLIVKKIKNIFNPSKNMNIALLLVLPDNYLPTREYCLDAINTNIHVAF